MNTPTNYLTLNIFWGMDRDWDEIFSFCSGKTREADAGDNLFFCHDFQRRIQTTAAVRNSGVVSEALGDG